MICKTNGLFVKVLLTVLNPLPQLPSLLPIWIESVRVGTDTTTWCKITIRSR